MKKKRIVKLAVIRSDKQDPCPFGLSIPFGCKNAGDTITKMAPLNLISDASPAETEAIAKANSNLLMWKAPMERCKYAGKLIDNKDVVECNWDENTMGTQEGGALMGSPFYYRHFSGTGLDGLYSYPLGYYTDNSIDRGLYYGSYSYESTGQENFALKKDSNEEEKE